jgi:hypothetical protein
MAITSEDIQNFLAANPGMTDAQIAAAMQTYGVNPAQVASATNLSLADTQSRFDVANRQNINQQVTTLVSEIMGRGGNEFDVAREASKLNLTAKDLSTALKLPEQEITKLSGGLLNGVPARPTFSGVAAEWNKLHEARFGTPLNLARAAPEDVQRQVADLQSETQRQQSAWDKLYGNTPEAKAIAKEAPPDWRQVFEPYSRASVERFGSTIDRPWSSDEGSINQKRILDDQYIKAVQDYNKKYGTNLAPDPSVLGTLAQPNEIVKAPEKDKWYENPLNIAALAAAAYFGAPYLAEAFGGAAGAAGGAAGGTGLTAGAGGVTGLTAGAGGVTGLVAPAGFTLAPEIGASLIAASALTPSGTPNLPTTPPVTPTSAPPNIPNPVEIIDRSIPFDPKAYDAIKTLPGLESLAKAAFETAKENPIETPPPPNTIRNIYNSTTGGNQPQQDQQLGQAASGMVAGSVDYSNMLNLLASQARTSGLLGTQFQPQPINLASLLGQDNGRSI